MFEKLHPKNKRHSLAYYAQVLTILIAAVRGRFPHALTASHLNAARIPSPTGLTWSGQLVKETLSRLRSHQNRQKSHLHEALLELIKNGDFTIRDALPLFQQRSPSYL